ncbi:hypothetical protein MMC08_004308 [Hypocenomyce scalaris]|nr:hypothetical protein [Hypocenomyce scalaris]
MANTTSTPPLRTNRNAFTPRLAGSSAHQGSPTLRRDGRTVPYEASPGIPKEDIATPFKAFLSSNVTPRSGSRKARVDSASSTPNGTPNGTPNYSKPTSTNGAFPRVPEDVRGGAWLGTQGVGSRQSPRPRSIISEGKGMSLGLGLASLERDLYGRRAASPENSPNFFHGSDVKSPASSQKDFQRPKLQTKTASFIRANGEEETDHPPSSPSTSPALEQQQAKFFYANGIPESQSPKPSPFSVPSSSPLSTASPQQATFNTQRRAVQQRPPSPLKEGSLSRKSSLGSKVSPRHHTRLVSNSSAHKVELKALEALSPSQNDQTRRSSLSTPVIARIGHAKSLSISSIDSSPLPRKTMTLPEKRASILTEPSNTSVGEEPEESPNNTWRECPNPEIATPPSPSKPNLGQNKLDYMNELAANARRERKVLDLEISNSSLLAINRTLEREMRKQNAELRRFRRLSRSGRLSMATTTRSVSSRLSTLGESDNLSNISGFSEEEADEPEFSDGEDSIEDGMLSPNAQAEHDARLRAKDEKRLQLDLSKHQELLIDSQKLNQSLKRCLGWTEELISEGKKALEYHVRVSDVEVGGRVLAPDENAIETTHSRGLLSPVHLPVGNPWDFERGERRSMESEVEDRDSGVDIARSPDLGPGWKRYGNSPRDGLSL